MSGDPSQRFHAASAARCLVLFTKPARPGRVKTRLIGRLSADQAAALHAAFLDDALERLSAGAYRRRVAWALDEREMVPQVPGWERVRQRGVDLGARLHHALANAAQSHGYVAAVGSDHPELDSATVEAAFERLEAGVDVVIGPAADGGYYLIALRRQAVDARLFSAIAWSTPSVREATLDRARRLGLTVSQLAVGHDVDDPAGLDRLAERLRTHAVAVACPRTREVLAAWGLLDARSTG